MSNRAFSVLSRASELEAAAEEELDVLVVGMGATGAGVALDAASRGLRVAVLDRGDLASGTSSKSSKLVHGGLRYLENYEFGLVREGVMERQVLLTIAPHIVRQMAFLYPVWPDTAKRRLLGLGLTTYDVFSFASLAGRGGGTRRHERISAEEAVALAPALETSGLAYSYLYGDCATDDARLVLAVVQAARRYGALTITHAEVTGLTTKDGRVDGALVHDRLGGEKLTLRARHVVNATGVWVDVLQEHEEPGRTGVVQPSKGVHVVVPRERLPLKDASILLPSKQGDGRSMFAIPWGRQTILGTTDTPYDGELDDLSLTGDDLDYVLAAGNAVFKQSLTADDVLGAWAGVRPLIKQAGEDKMSDISRRHSLVEGTGGLLTITGGKLTTYRRMAKDVVDRIVDREDRKARCRTDEIPLTGTRPVHALEREVAAACRVLNLDEDVALNLVSQCGETAQHVLSLVAAEPALGARLSDAVPHIAAEVVHAARSEGAATLDDVFSRRTRLSLRAKDAALPTAPLAASLLARELGHGEAWARAQVEAYADAVRAERGVLGLSVQVPAGG
ncbi:MAG TPA: glycerol-3-phosphate dehydrogenase/oxidase [Mycobacteriales bacterium]|nr:glycerol-3-phosphate dehydrogenase/oxidase [Mycobacteriales bacterium]